MFVYRATDKCLPFFDDPKGTDKFEQTELCEQTFQELKRYMGRPPLLSKPVEGEVLYLYLAVSPDAISVALVREEEKVQWFVYYVSKRLLDAEMRYRELEKLAYALVMVK